MKRVVYIFPTSHHYRAPFHEALRTRLKRQGIDYRVVYCEPGEENVKKRDTVDISWGKKVALTKLPKGLLYQHALFQALRSDLIIVQQENKLLLNYILSILSLFGLKKVAYFGHGRNFQARDPNSRAERWKRFWATKVDWWFGYTEATRQHVTSIGFPERQVTVFNNAVDTSAVRGIISGITEEQLAFRRTMLGLESENIGIFVGGLYSDKRLEFLAKAADLIRERVPGFTLLVVGGGKQFPLMQEVAAIRPWVKVTGPQFEVDKVELMMLSKVFLMPGLVGLAVVDAGVAGLPTITTNFPYHSPEIAYIQDGRNGVIVRDWENPQAYANTVANLFENPSDLFAMQQAAKTMAEILTIEAMADNFAAGVLRAMEFKS